jgi:hypothetical protein
MRWAHSGTATFGDEEIELEFSREPREVPEPRDFDPPEPAREERLPAWRDETDAS